MKLRRFLTFACLGLNVFLATASHAAQEPVAAYMQARQSAQSALMSGDMLAMMQQNPGDYSGRSVEASASVIGLVTNGDDHTVLLTAGGNTLSLKLPSSLKSAAWIGVGLKVRVLLTVRSGALTLAAAAPEYDMAQTERAESAGYIRKLDARTQSVVYVRETPDPVVAPAPVSGPPQYETGSHPTGQLSPGAQAVFAPYRATIRKLNSQLSDGEVDDIATSILYFSEQEDIDPRLIMSMIICESGFNINSTSRTGAMGLGQLMPSTAEGLGVSDAYDPEQNIAAAVHILRGHFDRYSSGNVSRSGRGIIPVAQIRLMMAAYNAGPGAVHKYHGVPPYPETQRYVAKVVSLYHQMCGIRD